MSANATAMPKEFARQLLACEMASHQPPGLNRPAAFGVCEKLRGPLGRLIGVGGYASLLARAQVLACTEIPWLCELQINPNGSLVGLEELEAKLELRPVAEGESVLVGHLLGLLVTFIGPALTLQLLHEVWPEWTIKGVGEEKAL